MTFKILIKKLALEKSKYIDRNTLIEYCDKLDMNYSIAINYLLRNRYLIRIFRGIFYIPSIEERRLNRIEISPDEGVAKALAIKGVKNWYFGLDSALKNISHEHYSIEYVINDTIFRPKAILILGKKFKFIKIKKELFKFGIILGKYNFSDIEKTVIDIIYLSRYNGFKEPGIKELVNKCKSEKLISYAVKYNKKVAKVVKEML